jgi:large subunit ribosomal protein L21
MYAVIETGGKQYRVEVGTVLEVEKLDVEAGATITLDRVLLVADGEEASIGRPVVDGAAVSAEVLRQDRADKVIVFKYRPKARRRVKKGHRQDITVLRVSDITFGGRSAAESATKAEEAAKTERQRLEEAAARQAAADAALAATLAAKSAKADEKADEKAAEPKPKATRARAAKAVKRDLEAEPLPDETPAAPATTRAFEVFEDKGGQWRWRLRADNGEILAMSEQGFSTKASLVRSLDSVRRNVAEAVDHTEVEPVEEGAEPEHATGFEIYEDKAGEWRWRLRAANGELLAIPEQGFSSKASVVRSLASVRRHVAEAVDHVEAGTAEAGTVDKDTTTDAAPRKRASRTKKDE